MKTTLDQIKSFSPCENGWKKLLNHLGQGFPTDKEFAVAEVVKSNGISDTFWLLKRVMQPVALKKLSVEFACDCAERVLHIYEIKCPENKAPQKAIEAGIAWLKNPSAATARDAAYAAEATAGRAAETKWQRNRLIELLEDQV